MVEKSILLIEPSEAERAELTAILQRLGYQVDAAIGSEDGLRLFAQARHDLVIVEVLLPGINGLKVAKIVKEQSVEWGGKVIVISKIYQSRAMEYDAIKRYGADAYFAQPFPLVNLLNAVSALIGQPRASGRQAAGPGDRSRESHRPARPAEPELDVVKPRGAARRPSPKGGMPEIDLEPAHEQAVSRPGDKRGMPELDLEPLHEGGGPRPGAKRSMPEIDLEPLHEGGGAGPGGKRGLTPIDLEPLDSGGSRPASRDDQYDFEPEPTPARPATRRGGIDLEPESARPAASPPPRAAAERAARPAAKPAAKPTPPPTPPVLADEGEFDPEKLGLLLANLAREKVDGLLALTTGEEAKQIYFRQGRPVFAQSTNNEETLGRMLLADGILTDEQYREAMVRVGETGKKLGTVLTTLGYLTSEDLYFHLSGQTMRKVARCFSWPRGMYKLLRDKLYPENAPTFEADPAAILLEGFRRYMESGVIEAAYERNKTMYVFPGGAAETAAMRAQLDSKMGQLLTAADGTRTLCDMVAESPLGLTETLRVLAALTAFGAVRLAVVERQPELSAYEATPPPLAEPPEPTPQEQTLMREIREFAVRLEELDLFEVLGLGRDAEDDDVNRAYLTLGRKFNPERLGPAVPRQTRRAAKAIMERLQLAYDTLHDPNARRKYERQLDEAGPPSAVRPLPEAGESEKEPEAEVRLLLQEAILHMERRRHVFAVEALRKAIAIEPKNADLRLKFAQAMFGALAEPPFGWDDVESAAREALNATKTSPEALALLGRIKARLGDDESALRFLRKAFEADPHNDSIRREIHYAEQRQKEAEGKKTSIFGKRR